MLNQRFTTETAALTPAKARSRCLRLGYIAAELQFWAKRYADGRTTGVVDSVNNLTRELLSLGIDLDIGVEQTVWAKDGHGRDLDKLTDGQLTPGSPEAVGWLLPFPRGTTVLDALAAVLGPGDPSEAVLRLVELKNRVRELEKIVSGHTDKGQR